MCVGLAENLYQDAPSPLYQSWLVADLMHHPELSMEEKPAAIFLSKPTKAIKELHCHARSPE